MTLNSTTSDSSSIFKDGKLKPGIYKIQNLRSQTYMDVHEHLREVCCRPATALEEGRGFWEIKPLGAGYSVRRIEPGKPEQFCFPLRGLGNGGQDLGVAPYPVAWKIEIVQDEAHQGFEYVRVRWGTTNIMWDLNGAGSSADGTGVLVYDDGQWLGAWRIWKLIPVNVEGFLAPSGSSFEVSSTHARYTESDGDAFGTILNEVAVLTTTVTTRKRYRVEDA